MACHMHSQHQSLQVTLVAYYCYGAGHHAAKSSPVAFG